MQKKRDAWLKVCVDIEHRADTNVTLYGIVLTVRKTLEIILSYIRQHQAQLKHCFINFVKYNVTNTYLQKTNVLNCYSYRKQ